MSKKIALVVGHGGIKKDPGALNTEMGITEFNLCRMLVEAIAPHIPNSEVVYRDTYANLPYKINETKADIGLEFHMNASKEKTASGFEVCYCENSKNGEALAKAITECMRISIPIQNRGRYSLTLGERGYNVVKNTSMPFVIVELCFVDNTSDVMQFYRNLYPLMNNLITTLNKL